MAAAVRMVTGGTGSTISSTDRTTAAAPSSSMTGLRVRCSVAGPSAAQIGPTDARSAARPACQALAAVQHGVLGEQRDVTVGVAAAGRLVRPGDDVKDVQPVGGGQAHGRSQRSTRSRRSGGKTLLGITACTALGGVAV